MIDGNVPGTFGDKKVLFKYENKGLKRTFVLFHGVYTSSVNSNKHEILARKLIDNGMGNVFRLETSRANKDSVLNNWEEHVASFRGKTFVNELTDVKAAIKKLVDLDREIENNIKYVFIGYSLGGTLASYLLPLMGSKVEHVFLFGSGVTTKGLDKPILDSYPNKLDILRNYLNFHGGITLIQGTHDDIVPLKDAKEVLNVAEKASYRKHINVEGVDHTFKNLFGVPREEILTQWAYELIKNTLSEVELLK